uniref:Uncharacterized protein n=1 Tax=Manihot esculenta TaxID=3983 RepID=A0A2C9UHZ8_MANES
MGFIWVFFCLLWALAVLMFTVWTFLYFRPWAFYAMQCIF